MSASDQERLRNQFIAVAENLIGRGKIFAYLRERGVVWALGDGSETDSFEDLIVTGVGCYTALQTAYNGLPERIEGGCSSPPLPPEPPDIALWRRHASHWFQSAFDAMPGLVQELNQQGELTQFVDGLTGARPTWGNVARIAARDLLQTEE